MVLVGRDSVPFSAEDPAALLHCHDVHLKRKDAEVAHEVFCVRVSAGKETCSRPAGS